MIKVTITQETQTRFLTEFDNGYKSRTIEKIYNRGNNIAFKIPDAADEVFHFTEISVIELGNSEPTDVANVGALLDVFERLRYANFNTPGASGISSEVQTALDNISPAEVGAFSGVFALNRKGPDYYDDHAQSGALTLSIGVSAIVGGIASVKITANGSGITGFSSWKNLGSDSISTANGVINHIIVRKTETEIQYTVKVM
ncbi:hypothetical protein G4D82_12325 [Flavobacterium sp. CYK-4]|uniref:hypothetical protein n=1 Tax=Flavobacterium lotistagni TaxID=2709660 RepID=UPI00140D64B3|nr:hypothetical protein [Flavobacterium lotistagni]NHM08012.1 hypothetical protein [Flavobacterium lotistagni]